MKVIVIEHDRSLMEDLDTFLKIRWPDCYCLSTDQAGKGIDLVETTDPDLVILDMEALDIDGIVAIKEIRKVSIVPLVVLSRIKDDKADVVKAFYYGADVYIKRPFYILEFLSRVNALLRRTIGMKSHQNNLDISKIHTSSESIEEAIQSQEENCYLETYSHSFKELNKMPN